MKRKNSTDYLGYRASNQPRTPKNEQAFYHGQPQNRFDSRDQYNEQQSFNQNQTSFTYKNNDSMKEDSDFGFQPHRKEGAFGHRFAQRDSQMNEDSGSRGYFEVNNPSKGNMKGEFQDNSLNRIKSEIERSRKLIEEFKKGENVQFS